MINNSSNSHRLWQRNLQRIKSWIKKDDSADKFTFLLGYAMELVVAFFVFYPLTSTVFFSGVLGCGRLPVLGGRPYEIWKAGLLRGNRNGSTNDGEVDEDDYEGVEGMRAYV
mmetsp:Transcript_19526/g.25240  ORF Transcript_19526/g.25240 Transcript_19526/m.25240 type:complete len:112 (+) Transcript_19526:101-436(+)